MFKPLEINREAMKSNKQGILLTNQNSFLQEFVLHAALLAHLYMFANLISDNINHFNKLDEAQSFHKIFYFMHKMSYLVYVLGYSIFLMLTIYGRYQTKQKHGLHLFNAETEVIRSREAITNKCDSSYNEQLTHYYFSTDKVNTNRLYLTFLHNKTLGRPFDCVWWEVGDSELLNQARRVESIFKRLPIQYTLKHDTKALSEWQKFLPHVNRILDAPSKARIFIYILALEETIKLSEQLLFKASGAFFKSVYRLDFALSLLVLGLQLVENYILNDKKIQYQLEGYSDLFSDYFDKYPTCVGQQLTADFVLVPNSTLRETINYLTQGHAKLTLLTNKMDELPEKLKDDIEIFMEFYEEHFCKEETFNLS